MISPTVSQADEQGEPGEGSTIGPVDGPSRPSATRPEPTQARRLLFLDDDPARAEIFLLENPQAVWVQTVVECVSQLAENWDEVHLDHDLGGQTFVDINETDCGMEVIRWLVAQPRDHLRQTLFFIHTHNSLAGLLMVLQMRSSGYKAEFRPFGVDPTRLLASDGEGFDDFELTPTGEHHGDRPRGVVKRWLSLLKSGWSAWRRPQR